MGMNLRSCCHLCMVQVFHFRNKESETLMPFYKAHYDCLLKSPHNIETKEDQRQAAGWMDEYKEIK